MAYFDYIIVHHTGGGRKGRLKELWGLSGREFPIYGVQIPSIVLFLGTERLQARKKLYERILTLSGEPTKYSDPNDVFDLPFPSVNQSSPLFLP